MRHVVNAITMALFPGRGRPGRDTARPIGVGLADGGLELSLAGLAYRTVNAVEALARGARARLATPTRRRGLTEGPASLAHRRSKVPVSPF